MLQCTLRVLTLVGIAVITTKAVNLSPFVDVSELNSQWSSFGSSSGHGEECLRSIERAKDLTSSSLWHFEPSHYSCDDVQKLCGACASCKHWSDGTAASTTEKNCICANDMTPASTTLSGKDDCFITANPLAALTSVDAGAGDDCFIAVQNANGKIPPTFTGGAGDDIFLFLNNDKSNDLEANVDGGLGDDCFYFGAVPIVETLDANYAYGGDGNDFFFIDTNVEAPAIYGHASFVLKGDAGKDLLVNHGRGGVELNFYGGAGNDLVFQKDAHFNNVYLGDGDDKIVVSGSGARGSDIYGGLGSDEIIVRDSAIVEELYGGSEAGVNTADGGDKILVISSANVEYIFGDYGDDYIEISGQVRKVYGQGDNDEIIADGDGSYLYGGDGDDRIFVYGGFHNIVDGMTGDNYIFIDSDARADYITGGDGDDTIILKGIAQSIYFGGGNNHVEIGSSASVYNVLGDAASVGYNHFTVSGHIANYLHGADGVDNILIESSGEAFFINAYGDDDVIDIKGRAFQVAAGAGDDAISVSGNAGRVLGQTGADIINFSSSGVAPDGVDAGDGMDVCNGPKGLIVFNCEMLSLTTSSSSSSSSS